MLISVIVPTYNRNDLLSQCLDRLTPAFQTLDSFDYEVIVTDDSKDNKAKQLVEEVYPWARWAEGAHKGPAANRNSGAKQAIGNWLVFIDDDCLPEKKLLEEYKKAIIEYPESLAFEGAIFPDDIKLLKKEMAECPVNTDGNCFWSANICINKELFERVHGFDEEFLIAAQEDQDIFEKLKEVTKIPFLRDCVVIHPVRFRSFDSRLKKIRVEFANWIYYTKKHSNRTIKSHLRDSFTDYIRIAAKDLLGLRFRLFVINIVKSFYSLYLFFSYKND